MRSLVDELAYSFTGPGTALLLRCRLPQRD
jgi:hypothetical protein